MKLGVTMPLGNVPRAFFDLTYFVASGGHLENQDFCHLRANGCS
jgi:hypothetical protein